MGARRIGVPLAQMTTKTTLKIQPIAPYRLDYTIWALRRRPSNIVDRWDGHAYQRVLHAAGKPVLATVRQLKTDPVPELAIDYEDGDLTYEERMHLTDDLNNILGSEVDMTAFYQFVWSNSELVDLMLRFEGVKPPKFPTLFEALVNGICCQQLTLNVGIMLLNRLSATYGKSLEVNGETLHAFPTPEDLTELTEEAGREMGLSRSKARAIMHLSQGLANGDIDLSGIPMMSDDDAKEALMGLKGIGRWTAEYVLLRGLGRLNIFPTDDSGALHRLRQWLKVTELSSMMAEAVLDRWAPYAGLVYFHLLLDGLVERGVLI